MHTASNTTIPSRKFFGANRLVELDLVGNGAEFVIVPVDELVDGKPGPVIFVCPQNVGALFVSIHDCVLSSCAPSRSQ